MNFSTSFGTCEYEHHIGFQDSASSKLIKNLKSFDISSSPYFFSSFLSSNYPCFKIADLRKWQSLQLFNKIFYNFSSSFLLIASYIGFNILSIRLFPRFRYFYPSGIRDLLSTFYELPMLTLLTFTDCLIYYFYSNLSSILVSSLSTSPLCQLSSSK